MYFSCLPPSGDWCQLCNEGVIGNSWGLHRMFGTATAERGPATPLRRYIGPLEVCESHVIVGMLLAPSRPV